MRNSERFFVDWGDVAAVGGLALLVLLLVAPALLPDQVLLPFDIVTEDWPPWQQPSQPVKVNNLLLADSVNYIVPVKDYWPNQYAKAGCRSGTPMFLAVIPSPIIRRPEPFTP